eukprot:Skav202762  [mRNA]  locus=scaffold326:142749:169873:+ [translate_table: standard]
MVLDSPLTCPDWLAILPPSHPCKDDEEEEEEEEVQPKAKKLKIQGIGGLEKSNFEARVEKGAEKSGDDLTVFVGGLPWSTSEEQIKKDFEECGPIARTGLMDLGRKGIAFVTYESQEGVDAALKYDGDEYGGRTLKDGKGKGDRNDDLTAVIKGLSWELTKDKIESDSGGCWARRIQLCKAPGVSWRFLAVPGMLSGPEESPGVQRDRIRRSKNLRQQSQRRPGRQGLLMGCCCTLLQLALLFRQGGKGKDGKGAGLVNIAVLSPLDARRCKTILCKKTECQTTSSRGLRRVWQEKEKTREREKMEKERTRARAKVEEALEAAKTMSAQDAGDASRVMQIAGRVRAAVRDLRTASRMKQLEQGIVNKHLAQADAENEKARLEMTSIKEVIDDKSLVVALDDTPAPTPVDANGKPLQQRFCEYFLERPDWRVYPNQQWFKDIDLKIYNQDLAGFFTSIPANSILHAVSDLLTDYHTLHPHLHQDSVISVDLKQQDTQRRLFRGKPRRASKQHAQLRMGDILPLCKLSLEASIFTQMGQCFQQVRGSAIGNQISPVLANITVSHTEHHWQRTHSSTLPPTFFTCRYVDNRLTLIHDTDTCNHLVREFLEPTFYQEPVLLEDEPDNSFLGCVINPNTRTLTYTHPTDRWQFHSWASATAPQHKLSAAFARIHLAAHHTFPPSQAQADVNTLLLTYEDLGYPSKPLRAFARRSLANRAK